MVVKSGDIAVSFAIDSRACDSRVSRPGTRRLQWSPVTGALTKGSVQYSEVISKKIVVLDPKITVPHCILTGWERLWG